VVTCRGLLVTIEEHLRILFGLKGLALTAK
jgi:hypothetical protein